MLWPRVVPLIGDDTSARTRADDIGAWAFDPDSQAALARIIGARRDIRRFRPDAVPDDLLRSLLESAHAAPSVGHSQPWRFVVVTAAEIRDQAARMADRHRLRQAAGMTTAAGRRMRDLQLDGIREAPLGVVVCCDRRAPAAGVLGRATFPDADIWSCVCAIQNLWLTARGAGLGVGWVTLFDPAELAELLGLPDGVEPLGWLCVGWPDERPPEPGLERAGWSERAPLKSVVMTERWSADLPPPVSYLASPSSSPLRAPDQRAVVTARDQADALLTPPGSLGVLDRVLDKVIAAGVTEVTAATLVVAGADHPVTAHGVSAYSVEVTSSVLAAMVGGTAAGAVAARSAGLDIRVLDAGVGVLPVAGALAARPLHPQGDLVFADALAASDVARLVEMGRELGAQAATGQVVALGEVGVGNTTVAAALAACLLRRPAAEVTGSGAGADTAMRARKIAVVDRAVARAGLAHSGALDEAMVALQRLGGPEFAVLTGVVLGVAGRGAIVVLDGLATSLCGLLAVRLVPGVAAYLVAGQRSREQAHEFVLQELGLEPLLDLRLRAGEGVGACLAVGLLRSGLTMRAEMARTLG